MKVGDKVRASFPYGGVPACEGKIIKEMVVARDVIQFYVSFEVRPNVFKNFYLTARELTLCPVVSPPAVASPVESVPVESVPVESVPA